MNRSQRIEKAARELLAGEKTLRELETGINNLQKAMDHIELYVVPAPEAFHKFKLCLSTTAGAIKLAEVVPPVEER